MDGEEELCDVSLGALIVGGLTEDHLRTGCIATAFVLGTIGQ